MVQQRLTGRAGGAGAALSPALDAEAHALAGHYVALEASPPLLPLPPVLTGRVSSLLPY